MSAPTTHHQKIKPGDVTVAIFVALVLESVAVVLSFDEELHCHTKGAKYVYRFGRIGQHCVVVAQPNDMGKVNASNISAHVTNVFPNVRLALMVGIGGGIPGGEKDIRLGDVVVSKPEDGLPGVLEYDFVRVEGDGKLVRKGTLDKPHPTLLSAVNYIEGEEIMDRSSLPENLNFIIRKSAKFQHPGKADVLYDITFRHVGGKDCTACEDCPNKRIVQRPPRQQRGPKVFHGLIMSGDSVVKDPYERLRLCDGYDKALCFEMEAAGIMDESPCLVVRGICDYCDTHKQGDWQYYAAAVAAAYARTILLSIQGQQVEHLEQMRVMLNHLPEELQSIKKVHERLSQEFIPWQPLSDLLPVDYDALHDSNAVSQQAPLCHVGTRKSILNTIARWTNDIVGETFFLLHGPAGTGKSTIARSIANQLETDRTMTTKLGASYFFNTPSSKLFFPTIAAGLMQSIPELKEHLWNSLEYCGWVSKAEIEGKDREKQLETLILSPIRYLSEQSSEKWSRVIVVDALDKCEKEHIPTICTLLSRLHGLDSVRFRIFLTSRSQGTIMENFHKLKKEHMARSLSILKYSSETKADIAKVLEANFADVKERKNIREDWPDPEDLNHLVELATKPSPLFIYAATVCRYVDNVMISTNPVWRLRHWLDKFKNASRFDEGFDKKFYRGLDQQFNDMYKEVLEEAMGRLQVHEREILEDVLCSILVLFTPLPSKCLAALLGKNDRDVDCLLPNLHAVLDIQPEGPVKILHESFRDCLLDPKGIFRVDALERHVLLTRNCVDRMRGNSQGSVRGLQRDMYGHGDYGKETKDIGEPISNVIPLDLEYACLNWVHHLESSQQCVGHIDEEDRSKVLLHQMSNIVEEVQTWLEEHLLHWIEALSLLGRLSDGISSIRQLRFILQSSFDADPNFDAFLTDAEKFALSYGFIIERFPLQIYSAALTFCPTDSEMNRRLGGKRYSDIPVLRGARIGWDHCLYTLKGHGGSVNAVAYSSRHKVLASASSDRTIRLWDDVAGAHKRTLQGHSGYVLDVAFSPDGNTLASASSDGTVWIWGVDKGSHMRTLEGHSNWVNSVAFLSDRTLASASSDGTVRLWDIHEGICTDTDETHDGSVNSVASARKGMVLASGSSDGTVHLWNFAEEPYKQETLVHNGPVTAVSFSPDGDLLASASGNWTVQVWLADTCSQVWTLERYRSVVNSVTFINSDILAIAPRDGTLRIWEPCNNHMQKLESRGGWLNSTVFLAERNVLVAASSDRTLRVLDGIIWGAERMSEGHDGPVNAVAFSPDGTWLASTSSDWTVRLWNAGQGTFVRTIHHKKYITEDQRTIDNYSCYILSIAFSPNGKILASGCSDWSIRLWDVDGGTLIKTLTYKNPPSTGEALPPRDQGRFVLAIAFSPDGMMIASGSSDWRVRLWNTFDKYTLALATLEGHRNWVRAVAFSTDGKFLASASTDGMLWLWDVEKRNNGTSIYEDSASNILRERVFYVNESTHQQDWVRTVAFSPDGKELAWALTDGTVSFLPLDFDPVKRMRPKCWRIYDYLAVAFSLDGMVLEVMCRLRPIPESPKEPSRSPPGTPSVCFINDPDSVWKYLKAPISEIMYSREPEKVIDMDRYEVIHNAIFGPCSGQHFHSSSPPRQEYLSVAYHYVYRKLRDYLTKHLERVVGKSKARTGEELLTFYNREWSRYTEAAKYTNHLLQYLHQTFIEQDIDKSTEGIYDVYTLYLIQWQCVILGSISREIIEVVLKLIESGRNGEIIENGIIKRVVESFISLGIDPDDPSLITFGTYRLYFEKPFLEATEQYYREESKHYLAEKGVVEYMRWAELRLDEEDELLRTCLHYDTTGPLRDTCIKVLVAEHSEVLRKNFQSLLDDGREEDMARTVNLLAHVPFGLAHLRLQFETQLRKAGLTAVVKISKLEPKIYVGPVCTQYHDLVRWASSEDMQSTRSSNDICGELITQHDACELEFHGFPEPFSEYNTKLTEAEGPTDVISITEDWIARDGRNLLCLPPDYRATCAARWNNVLVLGHRSGRVSFFQLP